jgi:tRNA nucleotidyltransferase (CCA-adding enzyme)
LFERCDAFRKPQRFEQMLLASECDFRGRGGPGDDFATRPYPQAPHLLAALAAARAVNAGEVAQRYADQPERIRDAVHAARVRAVKVLLSGRAGPDEDAEAVV